MGDDRVSVPVVIDEEKSLKFLVFLLIQNTLYVSTLIIFHFYMTKFDNILDSKIHVPPPPPVKGIQF